MTTIVMTLRLPAEVYEAWQQRGGAEAALEAQGLWPEQVQQVRWYVMGPWRVAELEVQVDWIQGGAP